MNPVIFVDEAGDLFDDVNYAGALRKMLDPEVSSRELMVFAGATIDTSRATIIFAGSKPIADPALRSRMVQIEFGPLGIDIKSDILKKALDAVRTDNVVLPVETLVEMDAILHKSINIIIDTDTLFGVSGVLDMQTCIRALTSVVRDNVLSNTTWNEQDTKVFVQNFYAMQTRKTIPGASDVKCEDADARA